MMGAFRSSLWRRMLSANLALNAVLLVGLTGLFPWTCGRDLAVNQRVTRLLGLDLRIPAGAEVFR
jgi:hypothetical protein